MGDLLLLYLGSYGDKQKIEADSNGGPKRSVVAAAHSPIIATIEAETKGKQAKLVRGGLPSPSATGELAIGSGSGRTLG